MESSRLIDITRTLQEAPAYPGSAPVRVDQPLRIAAGDEYNLSVIEADSHMGTHADAFSHYLGGDAPTIDRMPLEKYYGPCRVLRVTPGRLMTRHDLEGRIPAGVRAVLSGGGSAYLARDAAEYLVSLGVPAVVTDAVSVAPPDNEREIHVLLLSAGVAIIENADLENAPEGDYTLCAFPNRIGGCDGAPVRAVLLRT